MLCNKMSASVTLSNGGSSFSFLDGGDAFLWIHDSIMINAFCGNSLEGSLNNLYLRTYHGDTPAFRPLIGRRSGSSFFVGRHCLEWRGFAKDIRYTVTFRLSPYGIWFWDIRLEGSCAKADVIYSQDIGCAAYESVLSNELYTAQYLGHSIFQDTNGYCICSRQNMSQNGLNPFLQQGSLGIRTAAFSTDGTQFFGLSYKKTNVPEALYGVLACVNDQQELSHTALETETFALSGFKNFSFYGICRADHPQAVLSGEFSRELSEAFLWQPSKLTVPGKIPRPIIGEPYSSPPWNARQLQEHFPRRLLEEYAGDYEKEPKNAGERTLYSFFTQENSHVVLQAKELAAPRPHGHILITGFPMDRIPRNTAGSTNYMYGNFNCQLVWENANMNKLLSNHRGLLNTDKAGGQRIYVKRNGVFHCLALPSAYEMDIAGSTWYYQLEEDVLRITSFAVFDRPEIVLTLTSEKGRKYDFIVTHKLTAGPDEFSGSVLLTKDGDTLTIKPAPGCAAAAPYPGLRFTMLLPQDSAVSDDRVFFADQSPCDPCLLTVSVTERTEFTIVIQGSGSDQALPIRECCSFPEQRRLFREHYQKILRGFHLRKDGMGRKIADKMNTIILWYAHDALIHFASPHGLEQSGGAAWGTRDICQGPMEFFLTFGHFSIAREVLLEIFSHQLWESAQWPQWFMFDLYPMHQQDCHGDIIFWPLKVLSDYIKASGDLSILDEETDYRHASDSLPAGRRESVLSHVKKAVAAVCSRFLPGSFLISYAGGDWDDTLQPADSRLEEHLVSAWTQALAVQTFLLLGGAVKTAEAELSSRLLDLSAKMKESFASYLTKDGVIAGFLYLDPNGTKKYMLHPLDRETGIHYRLIPLTRTVISQLADRELAERNLAIIDKHLSFSDGVRLMDHPTGYSGGISKIFLRAEQAANIGREISLQYVHAHIRYVEALATMGRAEQAWNAMLKVNPIRLNECVKNALPRQSNVYFSSSDGCFCDRYEYTRRFGLLKTGGIPVKGGWRLYSSGPGIYIRRLAADLLGIRLAKESILIDPVLPHAMDGAALTLECFGIPVTFIYHVGTQRDTPVYVKAGRLLSGIRVKNRYRNAGIRIARETFVKAVSENPAVDVYKGCDSVVS